MNVTGYCVYVCECLILWKSKGQKRVTLSSTEEEYDEISERTKFMTIAMILEFMEMKIKYPILVHCDIVGAIYYVNKYVNDEIIEIIFVQSENNNADMCLQIM